MSRGPFSPDPRTQHCERKVRKGNHVWRDFGNRPIFCVYCRRLKGKRYA